MIINFLYDWRNKLHMKDRSFINEDGIRSYESYLAAGEGDIAARFHYLIGKGSDVFRREAEFARFLLESKNVARNSELSANLNRYTRWLTCAAIVTAVAPFVDLAVRFFR